MCSIVRGCFWTVKGCIFCVDTKDDDLIELAEVKRVLQGLNATIPCTIERATVVTVSNFWFMVVVVSSKGRTLVIIYVSSEQWADENLTEKRDEAHMKKKKVDYLSVFQRFLIQLGYYLPLMKRNYRIFQTTHSIHKGTFGVKNHYLPCWRCG